MQAFQNLTLFILICLSFCGCKDRAKVTEPTVDSRTLVEMVTDFGTIHLELYNETPLHRDNFIKLVRDRAYDSLLFHRVINGFMIQGGDPESRNAKSGAQLGDGDLGYNVKAEFHPHLFHQKGALATAREDNQDRASSAIQFYIVQGMIYNDSLLDAAETTINKRLARNHVINDVDHMPLWDSLQKAIKEENKSKLNRFSERIDSLAKTYEKFDKYVIPPSHRNTYKTQGGTPTLDQNYTVFGQVVEGLNVIDSIAATKTDASNRPIRNIKIISVRILEK